MKDFSVLIGGKAGDGIKQAANSISRLFGRLGYNIFFYDDYPSLIRGGHNFSIIRASTSKVLAHEEEVDCIVALNQDTVTKHHSRLKKGGLVVFDENSVDFEGGIGVPMGEIVKAHEGIPIMRNVAAIAAMARTLGIEFGRVEDLLRDTIPKGLEKNLEIAKAAFESSKHTGHLRIEAVSNTALPILTGNEAIALGAARAGLDIYIAYPMTPASSILHFLAEHGLNLGVTTMHPESEIGAALMVLGAAYAGKRAMTGTSGGGFALMTEALSMASQAEIPMVIVECQRTGPSTGVPTYTMQADLWFCLGAGHGDIQRVVVAPGDAQEAFEWAYHAVNAAWYFQVPVIVMSDKHLSESAFSFSMSEHLLEWPQIRQFEGEGPKYKRYAFTHDGISPLAFPGEKGAVVKATSYEHDEYGITVEAMEQVEAMQAKRLKKAATIESFMKGLGGVKTYGQEDSSTALIFWGSTKGAALEACEALGIKGVQPVVLDPFPEEAIKAAIRGAKKILCAETNATGQLAKLLRAHGIEVSSAILRYDGRPFTPSGLKSKIEEAL